MKKSLEPVRGTSDYLPQEMAIREIVRSNILKTYSSYGFMQVSSPILEDINNLMSSDGGDNVKLIFKVLKRGEKLNLSAPNLSEADIVDLGLRYDLTVPLVRLYSNNINSLPTPFKSIQIGYSFRADRPQRGRSRQFVQCDIDILGDASNNAEIDIINTTAKTFVNLGFDNFMAKVNDRRILSQIINMAGFSAEAEKDVCVCLDKLDKIDVAGVKDEMLSRGYASSNVEKLCEYILNIKSKGFSALKDMHINEDVLNSVSKILSVTNELSGGKYKVEFDISIVRGQGYYTGAVYEFYMNGFSGACAGGGRYDNMVEGMTGKSVPAVGLGLGFEPTCMLIKENKKFEANKLIACIYKQEDNFAEVLKYVEELNKTNNASAICAKKNIGFQLQLLKNNGFTHFCMFTDKTIKEI